MTSPQDPARKAQSEYTALREQRTGPDAEHFDDAMEVMLRMATEMHAALRAIRQCSAQTDKAETRLAQCHHIAANVLGSASAMASVIKRGGR